MIYIFNLGSGRSGTMFLSEVVRANAPKVISRHEANPPMHGAPIRWAEQKDFEAIRRLFRARMEYPKKAFEAYLESSHLFLKSFSEVAALEVEPERLWLTHLFRDPLDVAWSHKRRTGAFGRVCGENPYCLDPDVGVFKEVQGASMYQRWLLHWIEIENRAQAYLDTGTSEKDNRRERCFVLYAPDMFESIKLWEQFFAFFSLTTRGPIDLKVRRNAGAGAKLVGKARVKAEGELRHVVAELHQRAPRYLEIFHRAPYAHIDESWSLILREAPA